MINIESLPPAARKSDPLDGMRGLAVLIVFLSHTSGRDMALAPWLSFHGIGHVGVYLFFVLSAFLLTKGLLGGVAVWQFYLRRFFRIAPLYYLVLVGVLIFQSLGFYTPQYLHIEEGQKVAHFLFYRGDGVFWTIAAEYAFYLLLPPIVWAIGRFGSKWLVLFSAGYFLWFLAILMGISITPLKFVDIGITEANTWTFSSVASWLFILPNTCHTSWSQYCFGG